MKYQPKLLRPRAAQDKETYHTKARPGWVSIPVVLEGLKGQPLELVDMTSVEAVELAAHLIAAARWSGFAVGDVGDTQK